MLTALLLMQANLSEARIVPDVLVFSKTAAFRHASIEDGKRMFTDLAKKNGWTLRLSEDSADFTPENLAKYKVVVFLSTTGDVLDDAQQVAFQDWYRRGNGYVGIHAAADTEYGWPWYGSLVGAYFKSHPQIQRADVIVEDARHETTKGLPRTWTRTDEWYDYRINPRGAVYVLARLDPSSYSGSTMPGDHPITWCHEFDGGRAFYTGLGHTPETYSDPAFVQMVSRAIAWAAK